MFLVALTGGIASGKSTVCRMFREKGAWILESDLLAREVVKKGEPAWREIVDHFSSSILTSEGEIDRGKLAEIVFSNPEERAFLNRVTHPRIFQLMAERLRGLEAQTQGKGVVILDIPLLVEAKAGGLFHLTLVIDTPPELQIRRLMEDRGCSEEEARARVGSQVSREERLRHADLVIDNRGSLKELEEAVDEAWKEIMARAEAADKRGNG